MKLNKLVLCLALAVLACGSAVTALADAAVEEYWNYAYAVDRTVYPDTSDGLGLYMRYGPGTSYGKVNSRTIPNGTPVHITRECTAENGWKWGYGSYTFPGNSYTDTGWICLVETTSSAPAQSQPSGSAATQPRAVDRVLYIQTRDGLGLYMRTGPGTEYSKVNSRTVPNGTAIHITQEVTAANGWNWGWCSYQFPGRNSADSGWCCLVETTTAAPTAQTPVQQEEPPAQTEPAQEIPAAEPAPGEEPASAQEEPTEEPAEPEVQPEEPAPAPAGTYSSMALVIIGVVVGVAAAAAVLAIFNRRR